MAANLIQELSKVKDFRTKDGQRHALWFVLLIVIMGTMSGCLGYRALGDFVKRHQSNLIESFGITKERVPSYSTIRRVMMGIDFAEFAAVFNAWAANYVSAEAAEWFAIDGKSISGTVSNLSRTHQNFVSVVSVFSAQRGLVLGLEKLENKQTSEIVTVQALLRTLDLEGVVFSLDALHCQKTVEVIVAGGNDYVIAVKANQPRLYQQMQQTMQHSTPISTCTTVERTRDRYTQRSVSVFEELSGITPAWLGLNTLVKVERTGKRKGKPYQHTAYYISSLSAQAMVFAQGIRGHWSIENCLHWVKDVVLQEDCSRITQGNAPANFSIIRSLVVNLLRNNGYQSLTTAKRFLANDLEKLYLLLE